MARQKEAVVVTRASSGIGIEGEGVVWGVGAFAASILVGVALAPLRGSIGLENVTIVFLAVVALAGAVGGRLAGCWPPCRTTSSSPPRSTPCGSTPASRW
jgi:hypothetical protein